MRKLIVTTLVLALAGCSGASSKNGDDNGSANNDTTNNGSSTNGTANHGTSNNTTSNNTTSNNTTTNNTTTNNGTSNNTTNNTTTNNTTTNNATGPCPATEPADGDACTTEGLICEWGEDPREECRTRGTCEGGSWVLTRPTCDPLPDVECPTTREDASEQPCETMDAICEYDSGLNCLCTNCTIGGPVEMCGGDPVWKCDEPHPDPDCPEAKPRLGSVCTIDGKQCDYECGPGGGRTCDDSVWVESDGGPCPVSTRRVKRGIDYLSQAELAEISQQLQAIRLARWHYTDPSLGHGEKLGFIIEDLPTNTPAVDRERLMVDLYGYTSMLVADAQAREKRMQKLETRLEALENELRQCTPEH